MIHDAIVMLWDCPDHSELLSDEYHKEKIIHLNPCEKEIFNRILKIAKCHGAIRKFIAKKSYVSSRSTDCVFNGKLVHSLSGSYIQALSDGLDEILEPYRACLVELEQSALANPYLPLSYVLGTIERFKPLFNTISSILFSIKEKRFYGCQVLHVLQKHALSGNEETTLAIRKLIVIVHRVFYDQLCGWLLYGDLRDNKREFFIHTVENVKHQASSSNLNQSRLSSVPSSDHSKNGSSIQDSFNRTVKNVDYEINAVMLPYYIPLSMAQKILFIGRSVALFDSSPTGSSKTNHCLFSLDRDFKKGFTIWGEKEVHFHKCIQELKNMEVFNLRMLDSLLNEIKSCVTEHLWNITVDDAGVLYEIQLMKDFYLLGRGELFLELLRLTHHILDLPPTQVSARDVNQAFTLAARSVSIGSNQDIDKFSFSLPFTKLDSNASDMEYGVPDGWTVLVLNYKVKWPLHLLFTPEILYHYNEMFKFLLRVKKTQHNLHALWFTYSKAKRQRSSAWQLQTKLMFLIDNLQHYLQFDVLESNYSKIRLEAEKYKDFEILKKAHNTFLMDVLSQAFLLNSVSDDTMDKDEPDYGSNPVMANIVQVLQLCDAFCNMAKDTTDPEEEEYHIVGYTNRFETSVGKLLQLLTALRSQPCGAYLARLLMRLDFNRWFSNTHYLKQSHYLS